MQEFSIRDIEHLTGIRSHTLRIWEQRYSFFKPKRKESLRRTYDNEDLKQLLRVSFLYHKGWKISRIASLTPEQVSREVYGTEVAQGENRLYVTRLLEAAVDFDEVKFSRLLEEIIGKIGFEQCMTDVCYPYLVRIGLLWSTNHVMPAQEHFSSYIIQNKIIAHTDMLPAVTPGAEVIMLVCPGGEFHELPLLFINYLLRKTGWQTVYLGANISQEEMKQVAAVRNPRYLYLHLVTNLTGQDADDYLESLQNMLAGVKIIASGAGITQAQRTFVNVTLLRSDEEILNFIEKRAVT